MPAKNVNYLKKILKLYGFQAVGSPRYSTRQGISMVEETFLLSAAAEDSETAFSLTYEENNAVSFAKMLAGHTSRSKDIAAHYKTADSAQQETLQQLEAASEAVTAACEGRPFLVPNSK